jgi:hypothetical protein
MPVFPATWEAETGGLRFKDSLVKKLIDISERTSKAWWYTLVIPAIQETEEGRS